MDARSRRSRDRLHEVVLALAACEPIADISVSALCREAGITRDTFYRHADAPVDLLAEALGDELDRVMDGLADDAVIRDGERRLLEHVRQRADVYRGAMHPSLAPAVRGNLDRALRRGLLIWAAAHPEIVPAALADEGAMRMAVAYAAGGTVGAIEEWLRAGARDADRAVEVILAASPEWWLR